MYAATAAAGLSLTAFAGPAARAAAPPASGCAAVNLIVARASTELHRWHGDHLARDEPRQVQRDSPFPAGVACGWKPN